ncbi:hypothetical protein [Propionivibrio dicarboxylicus]|uniref:Uncharacterized protein n=1 Tax=Propionivibrio dicarboxylicus TaxID=83767 RepID=A0A1G7ZRE0_9RHOO|nr:hypothetical protein [Propionivibrio dicarboxylicus]SDH11259.1 hypothetical protein SAMN05660652_01257 [Propionivibrio dicarboxylicus]
MTRDEFRDLLAVAMHVGRILHFIGKNRRKRWIPVFEPYPTVCTKAGSGGVGIIPVKLKQASSHRSGRSHGCPVKPRA